MTTGARHARINRDDDGDPLGAAFFLGADELESLGLNLDRCERVEYAIRDGQLRLGGEE